VTTGQKLGPTAARQASWEQFTYGESVDDGAGVTALGLPNVEREEVDAMRELGVRFATTLDLLDRGPAAMVDELVPSCDAIYVSVDLDVLDIGLVRVVVASVSLVAAG
jgi:arginase family enzyme